MSDDAKKTFGQRVVDFVEDIATLDVLTLSGTLTFDVDPAAATTPPTPTPPAGLSQNYANQKQKKQSLDKLFEEVLTKAKARGSMDVVAYTHLEFDMDAVNFIKTGAPENILAVHNQSVKDATDSRVNVMALLKDLIT